MAPKTYEELFLDIQQQALESVGRAPDEDAYNYMVKWLNDIESRMETTDEEEIAYFQTIKRALLSALIPESFLN